MLIATHEMSFAREVADAVGFLHDGRILESGPPERVLSTPATGDAALPAPPARGRTAVGDRGGPALRREEWLPRTTTTIAKPSRPRLAGGGRRGPSSIPARRSPATGSRRWRAPAAWASCTAPATSSSIRCGR